MATREARDSVHRSMRGYFAAAPVLEVVLEYVGSEFRAFSDTSLFSDGGNKIADPDLVLPRSSLVDGAPDGAPDGATWTPP